MGVGGQRHIPAALSPGMTQYPLYRRLGRPQGRYGRVLKISPPTGIRSPDRLARSDYANPYYVVVNQLRLEATIDPTLVKTVKCNEKLSREKQ
jgi:hypothetical protein